MNLPTDGFIQLTYCRYAIDMMQSVCLDEFGGEKIVPPRSQETTLIQYIFGGLLQSQVIFPDLNIRCPSIKASEQ